MTRVQLLRDNCGEQTWRHIAHTKNLKHTPLTPATSCPGIYHKKKLWVPSKLTRTGISFYSQQYPWHLEQCSMRSKCYINICWMNKWTKNWEKLETNQIAGNVLFSPFVNYLWALWCFSSILLQNFKHNNVERIS